MKDKFQTFVFEKYEIDNESGFLKIALHYSFDGKERFVERMDFSEKFDGDISRLDRAVFLLHLVAGMSYFKAAVPKQMVVKSGVMTPELKVFCESLYREGMGEFWYRNDIKDWRLRGKFAETAEIIPSRRGRDARDEGAINKVLLPLGGGKDSIVTALLLRKAGYGMRPIALKVENPMRRVAEVLLEKIWEVERQIDPKILEWNKQGALNGHVPITAINSIVSVIAALIGGLRYVVFANERSADEGNVKWEGLDVNHQWSKSWEFEEMFASLVNLEVDHDLKYFSLLRPLSEYHIVKVFAEKGGRYFDVFRSCNTNFKVEGKKDGWCGKCPKCAFVFAMLAAWLPLERVIRIFGVNMFEDESLIGLWRDLLGMGKCKPFECVGEAKEMVCALHRFKIQNSKLKTVNMLLEEFTGINPGFDFEAEEKKLLTPSDKHLLPEEFQPIIDELK